MWIPEVEMARVALWRLPANVTLKAAERAEYLGAAGLKGVTALRNGRRTARDVYSVEGSSSGKVETTGVKRDGVEGCRDLPQSSVHCHVLHLEAANPKSIHPSSARLLACSHACRTNSASTVPP